MRIVKCVLKFLGTLILHFFGGVVMALLCVGFINLLGWAINLMAR